MPAPKKPQPAAPKTPRSKPPAAPNTPPTLRATPALKKSFDKLRKQLSSLRADGSVAYDALWELIDDAMRADPPLWLGGGYRSEKEFIDKELPGETARSVARNRLVARSFSPRDESRHGINFLEEASLYAQALAGASEPPAAIDLDRLKITLRRKDGDVVKKPVRDASIEELRQARRALRGGKTARKTTSPAEQAVRAALGRSKALHAVGVRIAGGTWSFSAVPRDALAVFGKAVASVKLPSEE